MGCKYGQRVRFRAAKVSMHCISVQGKSKSSEHSQKHSYMTFEFGVGDTTEFGLGRDDEGEGVKSAGSLGEMLDTPHSNVTI